MYMHTGKQSSKVDGSGCESLPPLAAVNATGTISRSCTVATQNSPRNEAALAGATTDTTKTAHHLAGMHVYNNFTITILQ